MFLFPPEAACNSTGGESQYGDHLPDKINELPSDWSLLASISSSIWLCDVIFFSNFFSCFILYKSNELNYGRWELLLSITFDRMLWYVIQCSGSFLLYERKIPLSLLLNKIAIFVLSIYRMHEKSSLVSLKSHNKNWNSFNSFLNLRQWCKVLNQARDILKMYRNTETQKRRMTQKGREEWNSMMRMVRCSLLWLCFVLFDGEVGWWKPVFA